MTNNLDERIAAYIAENGASQDSYEAYACNEDIAKAARHFAEEERRIVTEQAIEWIKTHVKSAELFTSRVGGVMQSTDMIVSEFTKYING